MEPSETTIENLSDFVFKKILNKSSHREHITVEGELKNCQGSAILIFEKKTFTEDDIKSLCDNKSTLKKAFVNDVYGCYECLPNAELNTFKTTVIYPATEQHIKKFSKSSIYVVKETKDVYNNITLPYILKCQLSLQWVYNILEHKSETERIIYENVDHTNGFVLLPDLKWDGKHTEMLYLLAITNVRNIKSIRDLNATHLPLLRNILSEGCKAIEDKYGVKEELLRIYVHYPPSFYHLHVHFTFVDFEAPGINFERAHSLISVINNLEIACDYYSQSILLFPIKKSEELFEKFKEEGCRQYRSNKSMMTSKTKSLVKKMKMEVEDLLGVCQFYIHLNPRNVGDLNEALQIKVTPTMLFLEEVKIPLPYDVLPQSISGLICRENRLVFRISLNRKLAVVNSNHKTFAPEDCKQIFTELRSGDSHMLQCFRCSHDILKRKIIIGQVVSEYLNGIDASDIFCHRDENVLEFEKYQISSSQSQSLNFGVGYFKLPNFDRKNLQTPLDNDIVYCEHCFSWLGLWNRNVLYLWIDTVEFKQLAGQRTQNIASKFILYNILRQTMNECFFPICNIRLVCKISRFKENCLNLTVFDRNNTVWEYDGEQSSRFQRVSYLKILFVFKRDKISIDDKLYETVLVSKATLHYTLKTLNSYCDDLSTSEKIAFLPM